MKHSKVNLKTKNLLEEHLNLLNYRLPMFKSLKGVIGIVLNGGLSRGYSDALSEIDILIYLNDEAYDFYQHHQTPFELGITMHEGQLYDISLIRFSEEKTSNWDSLMCWDRFQAKILYDPTEEIKTLFQDKATNQPPLDQASGLMFSAYWHIYIAGDIWIHRQDTAQGHYILNTAIEPLIKCLFLVNSEHIPHEKWLIHLSRSLRKLPNDYDRMIENVFHVAFQREALLKRQNDLKLLYQEVNTIVKNVLNFDPLLDVTYTYHFGVLEYLIKHPNSDKQAFKEIYGLEILNSAPFHPCIKMDETTITFDINRLVTLDPSSMYSWHYELVREAKRHLNEEKA